MSFGSQCNEIQSTGSAYHDAGTSPLIEMTTSANMATPDDNYECRLKSSVPFSLDERCFFRSSFSEDDRFSSFLLTSLDICVVIRLGSELGQRQDVSTEFSKIHVKGK